MWLRLCAVVAAFTFAAVGHAQERAPLPLAVVEVTADHQSLSAAAETLERVIINDLGRAGRMRAAPAPEGALNGAFAAPDLVRLSEAGARRALAINISGRPDGRVAIAARSFDVSTGSSDGNQYVSTSDNLRRIAHRIADRLNSIDGGGADLDSRLIGVHQQNGSARVVILDSDGANIFFITVAGAFADPRFGVGANIFYIAQEGAGARVMAMNLETNRREALTDAIVASDAGLAAARGAAVLAYARQDAGEADIEILRTHDRAILHRWRLDGWQGEPALDRDGSRVAFLSGEVLARQIFVAPVDGASSPVPLGPPGNYRHLAWSPDGQQFAIVRRENGVDEICIISATGAEPPRVLATSAHFNRPSWSPSGSLLFVSGGEGAAVIEVASGVRTPVNLPFEIVDVDWSGLLP